MPPQLDRVGPSAWPSRAGLRTAGGACLPYRPAGRAAYPKAMTLSPWPVVGLRFTSPPSC